MDTLVDLTEALFQEFVGGRIQSFITGRNGGINEFKGTIIAAQLVPCGRPDAQPRLCPRLEMVDLKLRRTHPEVADWSTCEPSQQSTMFCRGNYQFQLVRPGELLRGDELWTYELGDFTRPGRIYRLITPSEGDPNPNFDDFAKSIQAQINAQLRP